MDGLTQTFTKKAWLVSPRLHTCDFAVDGPHRTRGCPAKYVRIGLDHPYAIVKIAKTERKIVGHDLFTSESVFCPVPKRFTLPVGSCRLLYLGRGKNGDRRRVCAVDQTGMLQGVRDRASVSDTANLHDDNVRTGSAWNLTATLTIEDGRLHSNRRGGRRAAIEEMGYRDKSPTRIATRSLPANQQSRHRFLARTSHLTAGRNEVRATFDIAANSQEVVLAIWPSQSNLEPRWDPLRFCDSLSFFVQINAYGQLPSMRLIVPKFSAQTDPTLLSGDLANVSLHRRDDA